MDRIHFTQLVDEALTRLPKVFKDKLENLAVIVEDYPDEEVQETRKIFGHTIGLVSWRSPYAAVLLVGCAAVADLSLPEKHRGHLPQR
jgi:hypothetical protein